MSKPTIALASDHAGYEIKQAVKEYLQTLDYQVVDYGTNGIASVDYPDYAHPASIAVQEGRQTLGFLFCGSANGMSITANKHPNIRCALCWRPEIAALARQHNNANMCAIPARFVSPLEAKIIAKTFLDQQFEGGRHQNRVNKINIK